MPTVLSEAIAWPSAVADAMPEGDSTRYGVGTPSAVVETMPCGFSDTSVVPMAVIDAMPCGLSEKIGAPSAVTLPKPNGARPKIGLPKALVFAKPLALRPKTGRPTPLVLEMPDGYTVGVWKGMNAIMNEPHGTLPASEGLKSSPAVPLLTCQYAPSLVG